MTISKIILCVAVGALIAVIISLVRYIVKRAIYERFTNSHKGGIVSQHFTNNGEMVLNSKEQRELAKALAQSIQDLQNEPSEINCEQLQELIRKYDTTNEPSM